MKKTMLVLLSVLLVVTSVLALAACQQGCDKLGHNWGEWDISSDATCTEEGEQVRTCNRCGEEDSETIPTVAHKLGELVEAVAPDCTHDGAVAYKQCEVCEQYFDAEGKLLGDSEEDLVDPATGAHTWVADAESDKNKPATCLEKGVKAEKCSVCGATREVDLEIADHKLGELVEAVAPDCGHNGAIAHKQCEVCKQFFDAEGKLLGGADAIVVPAAGAHTWVADAESDKNKAATCLEKGVKAEKCSNCGATREVDLEIADHKLGELVPAVAPDCGHDGTIAHKQCEMCKKYFDAEGKLLGDSKEVLVDPAKGEHTWVADAESDKNKAATCFEKGVKAEKCSVCGATREVDLEIVDHKLGELVPAEAPDCGHDGTIAYKQCEMCEQYFDEEGELLGDSEDVLVAPATGDHSWEEDADSEENVTATCGQGGVQAYKCSVCEATKIENTDPTGEHSWEDDDDESREAERIPASCAPGKKTIKCSVCGALGTETVEPTGQHDFTDVELIQEVPATCTDEGTKAHKACTKCGLFCDEDGKLIGEGKEEDLVIPAGHKLDGIVVPEQAATCTADGVKAHQQCTGCEKYFDEDGNMIGDGEEEDLAIPSSGHVLDYDNITWAWPATESALDVEEGINASVGCENCSEKITVKATVVVTDSKEADYEQAGFAKYTATITDEDESEYTSEKQYTRPRLDDGRPSETYILVGQTSDANQFWDDATGKRFAWDHDSLSLKLDGITFEVGGKWKMKKVGFSWDDWQFNGSNTVNINWGSNEQPGEGKPGLFSGTDDIMVNYACTLNFSFNHKTKVVTVEVVEIDIPADVVQYTYTFHVYCANSTIGNGLQFQIWGALAQSDWGGGGKVKAEGSEHPNWYSFTIELMAPVTGEVCVIIHAGDTKYVTFGESTTDGSTYTMKQVTVAPDMYFIYNMASTYSSYAEAEAVANATVTYSYTFHVYCNNASVANGLQFHVWGVINPTSWTSGQVIAEPGKTGWYAYTYESTSQVSGKVKIIIHKGETKYVSFGETGANKSTMTEVTLATDMYFNYQVAQVYDSYEAAQTASISLSTPVAVLPLKFDLAA